MGDFGKDNSYLSRYAFEMLATLHLTKRSKDSGGNCFISFEHIKWLPSKCPTHTRDVDRG